MLNTIKIEPYNNNNNYIYIYIYIYTLLFLGTSLQRKGLCKTYYIKLDFIRVKYVKEYQDETSQEFKKMADSIKQEVKNLIGFIFNQV